MQTERAGHLTVTTQEKVINLDLPVGATVRLNQLTITRSRPAQSKTGRQVVTLNLTQGSRVRVVGISGEFKFKEVVINVDSGNTWAEVVGGSKGHMRSVPIDSLIPPTWAVRPRTFEYGIGESHEEISILSGD